MVPLWVWQQSVSPAFIGLPQRTQLISASGAINLPGGRVVVVVLTRLRAGEPYVRCGLTYWTDVLAARIACAHMTRSDLPLKLSDRAQHRAARLLAALPPRVQVLVSGRRPVRVDGDALEP